MKRKSLLLFFLILLTGCSAKKLISKSPPVIPLLLECKTDCNQGYLVVIRVYQLNADVNFTRATVASIWNEDHQKTLDKELVAWEELELTAGNSKQLSIELQEGATHLGISANFYQPDRDRWKQVKDVSTKSKQGPLVVELGKDYLILK